MDRIDAMRVFARVAETRSFRQAAADLGLPRSTVTEAVKRLEARLGVRLLDRTTRVVLPTLDGEAFYRRCLAIVAAVEDAETAFRGGRPEGRLHVNMHGIVASLLILPRLCEFLARYPGIDFMLSDGDRLVDLLREGVDCVIRSGQPADSDLIARRLGQFEEITCAAPAYLDRHGTPLSVDDLAGDDFGGHRMIGFFSTATQGLLPLEFVVEGRLVERRLPTSLTVTGGATLVQAGRLGFGLFQAPRYHMQEDLAAGRLVEVLPHCPPSPTPVFALYPRDRQLSPRLRVWLDWLAGIEFR
ncbi:MAG: LysR family transcriptional regulator [Kiloniellaceae bacterium]